MELGQKLSRRLFICSWIESCGESRLSVDQPRCTARTAGRGGGSSFCQPRFDPLRRPRSAVNGFLNPIMDRDMTPLDPKLFKIFIYLAYLPISQVISGPYFNRPVRRSISLHKRRVDPRDAFAEAVGFWYRYLEPVRLIL